MLDPEDDGTTIFRNIGNDSSNVTHRHIAVVTRLEIYLQSDYPDGEIPSPPYRHRPVLRPWKTGLVTGLNSVVERLPFHFFFISFISNQKALYNSFL